MLYDVRTDPHSFDSETEVLAFVKSRLEETWFERGVLQAEGLWYLYLIEGWEAVCIAEVVERENGDWDDDEYLYGLVEDLHNDVVKADFLGVLGQCDLVYNELAEGCQFGVSIIVARLNSAQHRIDSVCKQLSVSATAKDQGATC